MDATPTVESHIAQLRQAQVRQAERTTAIESILMLAPAILVGLCLALSLVVPYFTTRYYHDELSVSFLTFPFQAFAPSDEGEASVATIAFAVGFLLLLLVIVMSIIAIAVIARRNVTGATDVFCTLVVVGLAVGTLGAWIVAVVGLKADDEWILGPGLPLLTAAAILASVVTLLPVYRSLWSR